MTGGRAQLVNGILLIFTFFSCRIVWGTLNAVFVFQDIYKTYYNPPADIIAQGRQFPAWLGFVYLFSNTILNFLNYYWFSRMIVTLRARFEKPKEELKKAIEIEKSASEEDIVLVEGLHVDLSTTALELKEGIEELEQKKRKTKSRRT